MLGMNNERVNIMRTILFILGLCLLSLTSLAQTSTNTASLVGQTYESIPLKMGQDTYYFSHIKMNWPLLNIYGTYNGARECTAGTSLHLFPDGTFAWVAWVDIAPNKLVGEGVYRLENGRGILKHTFVSERYADKLKDASFHALGGRMHIGTNVVMGYEMILVDDDGFDKMKKIKSGEYFSDYKIRVREYYDWEDIKRDLKMTKNSTESIPAGESAAYAGKVEMIQKADVIVVVNITKVEDVEKKPESGWTYRQKATAQIEQCLKGGLTGQMEIYGMENFICARCEYKVGRYLLFLRKGSVDFWHGVNWHLGIRPVVEDKVEWFRDDKTRFEMTRQPLSDVIKEIQAVIKLKAP